jgi:C_GCAxxG_C_C family probable redox protein
MGKSTIVEIAQSQAGKLPEKQAGKLMEFRRALIEEAEQRGYLYDATFGGCAQAVVKACQEILDLEDEKAYAAAAFLYGGVCSTGTVCGALTGGLMILGMVYGRSNPTGRETYTCSGIGLRFVRWFAKEYGTTLCFELNGGYNTLDQVQREEFRKSQAHQDCFKRCGKAAGKIVEMVCEQGNDLVPLQDAVDEDKESLKLHMSSSYKRNSQ